MTPVSVLPCLSLLVFSAALPTSGMADVIVEAEVVNAVSSGRARVLVELQLDDEFKFEGELTEQGVRDQRAAIAAAQDSVLSKLGKDATVMRRPKTVPLLALEIGADALDDLQAMPDRIVRILKDDTAAAQRPQK